MFLSAGTLAVVGALGLFLFPRREDTGAIGFAPDATGQPPLEGPVRSPSGAWITPGTRDAEGYVLPLDVRALRPKTSPRPEAPGLGTTNGAARGIFEETRLGPDDGHTQNETSIEAVSDTLVAGWNSYVAAGLVMGAARSVDAGQSWSFSLFAGHTNMSDPAVKAGHNGRWYYAYLASGGAGGSDVDIYVRRSTDAGATWLGPALVTANAVFDDKPYLDASSNVVLVGWADFGFSPAKVRCSVSLDGGITFVRNTVLADASVGGNGACPVIGPAGDLHVFWRDSFQDSLWISSSLDEGVTWSHDRGIVPMNPLPASLPGGFRIVNLPSADANPISGALLVVWNDQALGDPDVLAIRSFDGGATWSVPVRINDDIGSGAQWFPWVSYDPAGVAHAVWYDRRNDASAIDVYTASSSDDGATWSANTRVTAAGFEPVLPSEGGAPAFIGDYNGIAATASWIYPFYQDARRGEQDVYVSRIPNTTVGVSQEAPPVPELAAAPNPFHRTTRIRLPHASGSELVILDASGRRVRTLRAHERVVEWDGTDERGAGVPPGVYFVRMGGAELRLVRVR